MSDFFLGFFSISLLLFVAVALRRKKRNNQSQKPNIYEQDIVILEQALANLQNESKWHKSDDRICIIGDKQSLFCAVAFAAQTVVGHYQHWGNGPQKIREIIERDYPERWHAHPIMDFNNHIETELTDVQMLLGNAIKELKQEFNRQSQVIDGRV